MLEFRDLDYSKDVKEVVSLIKENLQPEYTEEFLLWKHVNNPFGKSISMVAIEDDKIVGIVFYMRYNLNRRDGSSIKCIRPFDACTDQNLRGNGIFKKLMVECLNKYSSDYELLLANPNANSYSEFIKLGWKEPNHEYHYKIGIVSPFFSRKTGQLKNIDFKGSSELILNNQNYAVVGNNLRFVKWRYKADIYKIKEFLRSDSKNYIIYRIDTLKGLKCIVLCDFYGDEKVIDEVIKQVCKLEGLYLVYYLSNKFTNNIHFLYRIRHKKAIIVYKENNFQLPLDLVISLGDLEGRL
jgi:hypothetical protein